VNQKTARSAVIVRKQLLNLIPRSLLNQTAHKTFELTADGRALIYVESSVII
jgi:hypothetical protein